MTEPLFRIDPYRAEAEAIVTAVTPEGGLVLDRSIFYPAGGGQATRASCAGGTERSPSRPR